jgi:hypothetical protein
MFSSNDEKTLSSQIKSILLYILSTIAASVVISIALVISTQISGYHLQNVYFPVNKHTCTCDCWDGFFRGIYSRGGYKLFYFNYEKPAIVILCLLLFYGDLLRQTLLNMVLKHRLIFVLLLPAIYSNFYGAWSLINYINDHDYHRMLKSQIYFSITELIANFILYQCLVTKNKSEIRPWFIYLLCTISSIHILLALGELNIYQFGRNLAIISSDLISLIWITIALVRNPRLRPNKQTAFLWLVIAICLWLFYHIVCPFLEKQP